MPPAKSYRNHARAILVLGLPLIGSQMAQFAIHMTDTLMLGWYDVTALAAVTLASSYWFILFITGAGFGFAVAPMVASAEAAGDSAQVRRITRMGLWASMAYALAVLPLMYFSAPILKAMGQQADIAQIAQAYLRITCFGMPPALVVMVLKNHLAAVERTRALLIVTMVAVGLNAVADYALIFGHWGLPRLGVRGAALASVMTNLLSAGALGLYATRAFPEHALFTRFWRIDRSGLRQVFQLGWPIGLTSLAESGLFSASAVMVGWLGTLPLAAHGIALQMAALAFMVHIGLANTATVRAGQALGRRDEAALRNGAKVVTVLSLGFALVVITLFLTIPQTLIGLFLAPDDPERPQIIAIGVRLLAVAALFQLADATQAIALSLLRGVRDTRVPMMIAAVAYWPLGMSASYLFGFVLGMGAVGVWLGLVVGLATAGGLMMQRFWSKAVRIGAPLAADSR